MHAAMKYMKLFFLSTLLIIPYFRANAQSIKGRVLLRNSKSIYGADQPLEGVVIKVNGITTQTNAKGFFEIEQKMKAELFGLSMDGYEWVNAKKINLGEICDQPGSFFYFYMENARIVFSTYAQLFQQLNTKLKNRQKEILNTPSSLQLSLLKKLIGGNALEGFKRYRSNIEPALVYWSEKLAQANLDGQAESLKSAYKSLKSGQFYTFERWLDQTNEKSGLRYDLELAWLLANVNLSAAIQVAESVVENHPDDYIRLFELRRLYGLKNEHAKIAALDGQLLNLSCTDYQRFLFYATATHAYIQENNYPEARKNMNRAYNLGEGLYQDQKSDEFAGQFANLLLDRAFLEQSDVDKKPAERYYNRAVEIFEELGQRHPYKYESDLLKARLLLASFYFLEMDNAARAFPILNAALVIGQRLSRQYPQLYLDEIAVIYTWQGAFYAELNKPDLALEAYTLAARYQEVLATQDGNYWADAVNTNILISQIYYERMTVQQISEAKDKGLSFVKTATQQLEKLKIYNKEAWIEASNNLNFLRDAFSSWKP